MCPNRSQLSTTLGACIHLTLRLLSCLLTQGPQAPTLLQHLGRLQVWSPSLAALLFPKAGFVHCVPTACSPPPRKNVSVHTSFEGRSIP